MLAVTGMKKKKIQIYLICLAVISGILSGCAKNGASDEILLIDEMSQIDFDIDYPVGQITKGVTVSQDFVSNSDSIRQIWLYGATYMRKNTATVEIRLMVPDEDNAEPADDPTGTVLSSWSIDSSGMEDNSIIKLDVPKSEDNSGLNGKRCLITISSPDGEPDKSPTFWMTEEDVYPDGALYINGFKQYNDLWFQVTGTDSDAER